MSLNDEIERLRRSALEPNRLREEISRATESSALAFTTRLAEVMKANQHWRDMSDLATASSRIFTDLTHTHRTWLRNLESAQDQVAQLRIATKLSLGAMTDRVAVSELLFAGVDFDAIRLSMALPELETLRLRDSINDMAATYGKLAEAIHTYSDITHLPRFVLPGATREVFVTGYATNMLGISDEVDAEQDDSSEIQSAVDEVEEEISICASLLKGVDPALARPYEGARNVLYGTNPDRVRHFLSSQRELWNHLLRIIAPDEQVQKWIPKDGKDLLHEGKPTRKARILYICRDLNHDSLTEFVVHDTRALVTLVDLFNRVHQLEPKLSDQQLRALQLRTDSWLTYILQIRKESQ